jgi:chromosome segregation ATPase
VVNGNARIEDASSAYQKAQTHLNQLLAKLAILLGVQVGQLVAGGVEGIKSAGNALRSKLGGGSIKAAASSGLSDIANRAAQEAELAVQEVATDSALVAQLQDAALSARGEFSAMSQSIATLKAGLTDVTTLEGQVESAGTELQTAEQAASDAGQEAETAGNRLQRVKENVERAKQLEVATGDLEKMKKDALQAYREYKAKYDAEFKTRVDAKVDAALDEQVKLGDSLQQLQKEKDRLLGKGKNVTMAVKDMSPADRVAINQVDQQISSLKTEQEALAAKKGAAGFRQAMEKEVENEPASAWGPEFENAEKQYAQAKEAFETNSPVKEAEIERLQRQIDPAYDDPSFYDTAEKQLQEKQELLRKAQAARDTAKENLDSLKGKLTDAQQQTADLQKQIADKEGQLKLLDDRANALEQQESGARKKLDAAQKIADQKQDEARRLGQAALDSGGSASTDAGSGLGAAAQGAAATPRKPSQFGSDQSYDPFAKSVDKWKPDIAYWIEEKLQQGGGWVGEKMQQLFGVQSPDEITQVLLDARQDVQNKLDDLNAMTQAYNDALKALEMVKPKLDACIQQNTYYQGDTTIPAPN